MRYMVVAVYKVLIQVDNPFLWDEISFQVRSNLGVGVLGHSVLVTGMDH
jgi:hypothetical protein